MDFVIGQRVVNDAEPYLGLGLVSGIPDSRTVEISFPALKEQRFYRVASAPLRRLILRPGHLVTQRGAGSFRVEKVTQKDGLITYHGQGRELLEQDLEDRIVMSGSLDRMREGHVGVPGDLRLRQLGWELRSKFLSSRTRGLGGSRVALLPHQLFLAYKVSRMENPRVLLSDQVGLGKTIEAGLIFSVLRSLDRAGRVLVVLPDSLVHQWLAEMARRFNEIFSLVGQDALQEASPLESARRVLIPWSALKNGLFEEAKRYKWDLLIVDEAHHLHQGQPAYDMVSSLASVSKNMLLLTATPSRGGKDTEFGLLKLVDQNRYSDYEQFCEQRYAGHLVSDIARNLREGGLVYNKDVHEPILEKLAKLFPGDKDLMGIIEEFRTGKELSSENSSLPCPKTVTDVSLDDVCDSEEAAKTDDAEDISAEDILGDVCFQDEETEACNNAEVSLDNEHNTGLEKLENALLDRHGPGRVLFRNRRDSLVDLFPGRVLHGVGVEKQAIQLKIASTVASVDPRIAWIADFMKHNPKRKLVLIAKRYQVVLTLRDRLRICYGIHCATFYEELSVLERDRQAAWFADPEGANILLCSEIGSEGRNFQFAHDLLFWDIPLHPDVIEQRIGRLDRIGQKQPVEVYVFYFNGGKEQTLFQWHKTVGSFNGPLEGGEEILDDVDLFDNLDSPHFDEVIKESLSLVDFYKKQALQNVDYLVDLNSCNLPFGNALKDEIESIEKSGILKDFVFKALEKYGVEYEELTLPGLYHVKPGELMVMDSIPGLRQEGMLATFDRSIALEREEVAYLTFEHTLVKSLLSLILDGSEGTAGAVRWHNAPKNGFVVQFSFVLEALGPDSLELQRYMPTKNICFMLDLKGNLYTEEMPNFNNPEPGYLLENMKTNLMVAIWSKVGPRIESAAEKAEKIAAKEAKPLIEQMTKAAQLTLDGEIKRLEELMKVNPTVDPKDLEALKKRSGEIIQCLETASPRLDSVFAVLMEARTASKK